MKILIGTNNQGKVKEIEQIFKDNNVNVNFITLKDLPKVEEPIEDANTFLGNAIIKAKYYYNIFNIPVICDDSGLVIEDLGGEPGVKSARYAAENDEHPDFKKNIDKVITKISDKKNRNAYFETAMVFCNEFGCIMGRGRLKGKIIEEEKGNNGFGYDSIFFLPEFNKTLAELEDYEKNHLSHRYFAILDILPQIIVAIKNSND